MNVQQHLVWMTALTLLTVWVIVTPTKAPMDSVSLERMALAPHH